MSATINRRTALAITAGTATTAIVAPASTADNRSELAWLIDAHREAVAVLDAAFDAEEAAATAYKASPRKMHLVMTTPGTHREIASGVGLVSPWWEIRDEAREAIAEDFDRLRRAVPRALSDEVRAASFMDINRQQIGAYRRLVKELGVIREEQERFGYAAGVIAREKAMDAELGAFLEFCACPCRSLSDVAEKVRYLRESRYDLDGMPDHLDAFIDSLNAGA